MKKITLLTIFLVSILIAGCGGESDSQTESEAQDSENQSEEMIVRNAVFTDLDGNEVKIDQYHGKLVLIDFWETWCGPCLQVFPAMQDLREEYPDKFDVLAVTVGLTEGPEEARVFAEQNDYDFEFLFDQNNVYDRLGGRGIPFKVFVDPEGNLVSIEMGSYGREEDYNKAKKMIAQYFDIESE